MIRFLLALTLCLMGVPALAQSTFTLNIHNAPGWLPSHSYTFSSGPPTAPFTRVNNGPAWNGSVYTNGLTLNNYQLISGGTCVSASSGGPTGTGSSISDGTCTWKYVSGVDYITFTGWALDTGTAWASGTDYSNLQMVYTGANSSVYQIGLDGPGTPSVELAGCHSTVQPTGTSLNVATGDGCIWSYVGQIGYTSNAHPMPQSIFQHDTFTGSIAGTTLTVPTPPTTYPLNNLSGNILNSLGMTAGTVIVSQIDSTHWTVNNSQTLSSRQMFNATTASQNIMYHNLYVAQLWNDAEYLGGVNGENNPIRLCCHNWAYNDSGTFLNGGTGPGEIVTDGASGYGYPITIKAATGEGFADTLAANPSVPLSGYNANNGVAMRGTGVGIVGLLINDNIVVLRGIQVRSDSGDHAVTMNPGRACNMCSFVGDIFDTGSSAAETDLECGAQCYFYNDLFVARGFSGLMFDYGGRIYNSTIVCPTGTCAGPAVYDTWSATFTLYGAVMDSVAAFGFAHHIATLASRPFLPSAGNCTYDCSIWHGTGNATDVASTDGNAYPTQTINPPSGGPWYLQNFQTGKAECASSVDSGSGVTVPGTCGITNSLSPSATFTTWPGNYRIGPSSPLYGNSTGPYGNFNSCGEFGPSAGFPTGGTSYSGCFVQPDTPDIIGTSRPISGRYDIGALEYAVVGPFTFTGNSLSATTFVQGNIPSTVVGAVIVGYTGTPTGTTTISLSGANAQGFRLDTPSYPGANLICPSGGCPFVASVTDINVVATNAAATGSPQTSPVSLTGTPAAPISLLRVGNSLVGLGHH